MNLDLDANISNNTKTEVWKAQVDIEVKTIDTPDSVVVPLYLLCDNEKQSFKSGKYVYTELPPEYQEQIKNGDFPTLTTQHTLQVKIDDAIEANEIFDMLMGERPELRRDFINENADKVKNLDI